MHHSVTDVPDSAQPAAVNDLCTLLMSHMPLRSMDSLCMMSVYGVVYPVLIGMNNRSTAKICNLIQQQNETNDCKSVCSSQALSDTALGM